MTDDTGKTPSVVFGVSYNYTVFSKRRLPTGVTEIKLAESLNEINAVIVCPGYKDAGYSLYKVRQPAIRREK